MAGAAEKIAPGVMRAGVLRDPSISSGIGQFAVIQSVASSVGIEVTPVNLQDVNDIKGSIAEIADAGNGGLILTSGAPAVRHGGLIIDLATRHKLPMVCFRRRFVDSGGLISYGPDIPTSIGALRATSIASSRARSRPTCRYRRRPDTSSSSISRPRRRSESPCRRACSPALTR